MEKKKWNKMVVSGQQNEEGTFCSTEKKSINQSYRTEKKKKKTTTIKWIDWKMDPRGPFWLVKIFLFYFDWLCQINCIPIPIPIGQIKKKTKWMFSTWITIDKTNDKTKSMWNMLKKLIFFPILSCLVLCVLPALFRMNEWIKRQLTWVNYKLNLISNITWHDMHSKWSKKIIGLDWK